jgi:hypothetical protein
LVVAQRNEQEFVVESIVGHRGNRTKRSTMEFKVRWVGFGESCDSWEAARLPSSEHDEDFDSKRTQVERTENLFQDFPRNVLPRKGLFPDWFLVGETPHISVQPTSCITLSTLLIASHTSRTYNLVKSGGPSFKKRGLVTQ